MENIFYQQIPDDVQRCSGEFQRCEGITHVIKCGDVLHKFRGNDIHMTVFDGICWAYIPGSNQKEVVVWK